MSMLSRLFGGQRSASLRVDPVVVASSGYSSGTSRPSGFLSDIGYTTRSRVASLPPVYAIAAQKHATVTACCSIIAGDLSKVKLKLYQRDADGSDKRIEGHPAEYVLNKESSPGVAATVARFSLVYAYCLRGEAFAYVERDAVGSVHLIDVIKNDRCHVLRAGRDRFYDFEDGAGVYRRVSGSLMAHLRYMADDSWCGRSPIEVAAESMGLALAGQESAARTASGRPVSVVVEVPDLHLDEEAQKRSMERLASSLRNPEDNGIAIVPSDVKINRLDMSAADQQLLESRKFDVGQIRALYRVPAFKLQDAEHGVKANGEQQAIDYLTDCLLHWATQVETQLMLAVLTEEERRDGYFFRHDFGSLLRPTIRDQYDALTKAVGGPIMTPNEARKIISIPRIDDGDRLNPAPNMTREEKKNDDA